MALGLRNYLVQTVAIEVAWCERGYGNYAEALCDGMALAVGAWPMDDAPRHPIMDVFRRRLLGKTEERGVKKRGDVGGAR